MSGHPTFVIIVTAGEELVACDSVVLIYLGKLEGLQVEGRHKETSDSWKCGRPSPIVIPPRPQECER